MLISLNRYLFCVESIHSFRNTFVENGGHRILGTVNNRVQGGFFRPGKFTQNMSGYRAARAGSPDADPQPDEVAPAKSIDQRSNAPVSSISSFRFYF